MNNDILTAENAVLGACLCDNTGALFRATLAALHEADLAGDPNRCILHAARELDAEGKVLDAPAVRDRVHREDVNNEYLLELMNIACAGSALDQNIAAIKRAARLRTLSQLGENIAERARAGDEPNSITGDTAKVLDELDRQGGALLIDSTAALRDFHDFRESDRSVSVPTGILGLDRLFGGGFLNCGLYILAARPGCGKTALALQISDTAARNTGAVLFVSLEMDAVQLTARRVARLASIPSNRLLMGRLDGEESAHVSAIERDMQRQPLYLNRQTRCSGDLKALARYLGVPVLCLAQLNRASELRQDKKPSLADLRDSGAIEQDADGVLLLYREDMYWAERPDEGRPVTVECTLAKHRHGAVGAVTLALELETGAFMQIGGKQ